MDSQFYLRCFLVGMSVASAVGPIFVLTFNRGACFGFVRGFITAVGAALGDCFLFFLGLLGVLQLLGEYKETMWVMDLIGGSLLIFLGIRSFRGQQKYHQENLENNAPLVATAIKSFILTIINPLTVLFFMFIGVQILPDDIVALSLGNITTGSSLVFCGSLTVLTIVAFTASRIRHAMSEKRLITISHITGVIFFSIGFYFFGDFIVKVLR